MNDNNEKRDRETESKKGPATDEIITAREDGEEKKRKEKKANHIIITINLLYPEQPTWKIMLMIILKV